MSNKLICLLFPPRCVACGIPIQSAATHPVCGHCLGDLRPVRPPFCPGCGRTFFDETARCASCSVQSFHFDRAYACLYYDGRAKELLHAFKFGRRTDLAGVFAEYLSGFAVRHLDLEGLDAAVAVPLDPGRCRERGFNQAGLLCAKLSKTLGLPDLSRLVTRTGSRSSQAMLAKNSRQQNVLGHFHAKHPSVLTGKRILLVDDVLTTGHTLSECAHSLKKAGALSVIALTVARGY